jgi:hypothetical protein
MFSPALQSNKLFRISFKRNKNILILNNLQDYTFRIHLQALDTQHINPFGGGLGDATVTQWGVWGEPPQCLSGFSKFFIPMKNAIV